MGNVVMAAKITHVPTIWMSHTIEKYAGIRQAAIDGYAAMKADAEAAGVDTFVIFDSHWIVNQGFHLNAKPRHAGTFTSHELPHMLSDMDYDYEGDPKLAALIAEEVAAAGENAIAHETAHLGIEYGTLVPMHFINDGGYARVLPIATNQFASIEEGRRAGAALAKAISRSDRKVALLASGSMSHAFWPNHLSEQGRDSINGEFNRQVDLRVLELWQDGQWGDFLEMLPAYAEKCAGEVGMMDTAMLFGALGWDGYDGEARVYTPYFASSGTGQVNIGFSVNEGEQA